MNDQLDKPEDSQETISFFDRPGVQVQILPIGPGVPLGIEQVSSPSLGIGGAYGTWGESYDNASLPSLVEHRLGAPLDESDRLDLSPLGFDRRHHITDLTDEEHYQVEIQVGAQLLRAAAQACGWEPSEVDAVMIGLSGPIAEDYTEQIARAAGVPESALKVSIHKACDGSVGALHLALNPDLPTHRLKGRNIAEELYGKKVLVGGIEGLSRFIRKTRDKNAMQLFGNGAGVIGLIPGKTMKFLVGKTHEVFDDEGVLAVRMYYPHSRHTEEGGSMVEVTQTGEHHIRIAGLMHEPEDASPVVMAGPMGMVKLFVRSGVDVVRDVYAAYQARLNELGMAGKQVATTVVHHANLKINRLKEKHLQKEGINLPMPWVIKEFGNVSAASNMIAFLRQLPGLRPGDHVLFDGFGAGTYYDVLAVILSESPA